MESDILSSDRQAPLIPLGDRFDDAIGETSSDIGALLSELVRRSLKAGVSEIGESLVEFAQEQAESAILQQMPAVAEAADGVAQSTAKRVAQQAVDELSAQSEQQHQLLESKIHAAETSAVERSRSHVDEVVSDVRRSVDETRILAVEGKDSSERKIQELREKARQSWCKVLDQFNVINHSHQELRAEHEQLCEAHKQLHEAHEHVREEFARAHDRLRQQADVAEEKCSALLQQNRSLAERLAVLEQPRGIKALLARFRRADKTAAEAEFEEFEEIADSTDPAGDQPN